MKIEHLGCNPVRYDTNLCVQAKEFDKKPNDTLAPKKQDTDKTEPTWGDTFAQWACFIPNIVVSTVKSVFSFLFNVVTCQYLYSSKLNLSEVSNTLDTQVTRLVGKDADAAAEAKKEIKKFFSENPKVREHLVDSLLERQREKEMGDLVPEAAKKWNEEHRAAKLKEVEERIEKCDQTLLTSYNEHLKVVTKKQEAK